MLYIHYLLQRSVNIKGLYPKSGFVNLRRTKTIIQYFCKHRKIYLYFLPINGINDILKTGTMHF